jgi:hypothetical protein
MPADLNGQLSAALTGHVELDERFVDVDAVLRQVELAIREYEIRRLCQEVNDGCTPLRSGKWLTNRRFRPGYHLPGPAWRPKTPDSFWQAGDRPSPVLGWLTRTRHYAQKSPSTGR